VRAGRGIAGEAEGWSGDAEQVGLQQPLEAEATAHGKGFIRPGSIRTVPPRCRCQEADCSFCAPPQATCENRISSAKPCC
jgi:hypothetical protein